MPAHRKPHGEFVHCGDSQESWTRASCCRYATRSKSSTVDLVALIIGDCDLARTQRDTPMVGRDQTSTRDFRLTFGSRFRLAVRACCVHMQLSPNSTGVLQVQFVGAVGTFSSLGDDGDRVTRCARPPTRTSPSLWWHGMRRATALAETFFLLGRSPQPDARAGNRCRADAQTEGASSRGPGGQGHVAPPATCAQAGIRSICEQILSNRTVRLAVSQAPCSCFGPLPGTATGPWQAEGLFCCRKAFMLIARAMANAVRL